MSETDTRLQLSGRITYQQDLTAVQAAQVIALVNNADPSVAPPRSDASAPLELTESEPSPPRRVETPRQALEASGAKTMPEKIVALAAYCFHSEGDGSFTAETMRALFLRARESIPRNFSREVTVAIRAGWVGERPVRGHYYLLGAAEGVLDHGFASLRRKRTRGGESPTRRSRRRPRTTAPPDVFADLGDFPTSMSGLPPYHRVKLKRDKMLWALVYAKRLGVPKLKNAELSWLTDRLGEGILTRDVNGHYKGLLRQGYANRSTSDGAIRATEAGESYLDSLSAPLRQDAGEN